MKTMNLAEFKSAYQKAVEENQPTFFYKEVEFLTQYAHYLIQYLES